MHLPGNTVSHAHIKISLIRAWRTDKGNKVISRIGNRARPTLSHACTFSLGYLPLFLPNGDCIGYERKTKFANNLRARIRMSRLYRNNVCTVLCIFRYSFREYRITQLPAPGSRWKFGNSIRPRYRERGE